MKIKRPFKKSQNKSYNNLLLTYTNNPYKREFPNKGRGTKKTVKTMKVTNMSVKLRLSFDAKDILCVSNHRSLNAGNSV